MNCTTQMLNPPCQQLEADNARLREELDRAKQMPMKYRRMEFNAQLQKESDELREQLAAAESLRAGQQKFYVGAVADAKRYRWLREYLPSDDESWDDALVAAHTPEELDAVIDDAIAKEQS